MSDAKAIQKHSAQYDLFHRLHSIAADERFVRKVAQEWYSGRFEVVDAGTGIATLHSAVYAYFKSTDGHTNNWDFNLRRSNLPLANHAEKRNGLVLVDSTRRGKRMPDALSKTVPIWCAVINLAIQLRRGRTTSSLAPVDVWDTSLYLPPRIVSASEKAQIESRLDSWADALERSSLPLPNLKRPLRPFFIHPSTSTPPQIPTPAPFIPIICVSASRWIKGDQGDEIPSVTRLGGGNTVGFEYVPGGGDDDELWGRGLSSIMFHEHKVRLLSTPREELPEVVDDIVKNTSTSSGPSDMQELRIKDAPSSCIVHVPTSQSRLAVDIGAPVNRDGIETRDQDRAIRAFVIRVVLTDKVEQDLPYVLQTQWKEPVEAVFMAPNPRTDPKPYSLALAALVDFVREHVAGDLCEEFLLRPGSQNILDTAIRMHRSDPNAVETSTPPSELALSPAELLDRRKAIIPLALVLLCSLPELAAQNQQQTTTLVSNVTKSDVANHLHSLVALWPDGNPPRAALKRVNGYLMGQGRR